MFTGEIVWGFKEQIFCFVWVFNVVLFFRGGGEGEADLHTNVSNLASHSCKVV